MLKGRSHAVLLAILIHVVLIIMVSKTIIIPRQSKIEPKAINSYLYKMPKQAPVDATQENAQDRQATNEPQAPKIINKVIEKEILAPELNQKTKQAAARQTMNHPLTPQVKQIDKPSKPFSALKQLDTLRKNLDKQIVEQSTYQLSRRKSASILDGKPDTVPHSHTPLTQEQKIKQAPQQLGNNIQMLKGDDGACYVKRDLSDVGMEGLTSVEAFSCGMSKFDRSFKEHMKKVRDKLGK